MGEESTHVHPCGSPLTKLLGDVLVAPEESAIAVVASISGLRAASSGASPPRMGRATAGIGSGRRWRWQGSAARAPWGAACVDGSGRGRRSGCALLHPQLLLSKARARSVGSAMAVARSAMARVGSVGSTHSWGWYARSAMAGLERRWEVGTGRRWAPRLARGGRRRGESATGRSSPCVEDGREGESGRRKTAGAATDLEQ
jgi:hypothetical protein